MYSKKILLMQHLWTPETEVEGEPGSLGSGKSLDIRTLSI
jgi:hypothetical protein